MSSDAVQTAGSHVLSEGNGSTPHPLRHSSRIRMPSRRAEEMTHGGAEIEAARSKGKSSTKSTVKEKSVGQHSPAGEDEGEGSSDEEVYCICRKGDNGSPMVFCGECEGWYHFKCVELTKKAAESVLEFVCPPCNEKTSRVSKVEGTDEKPTARQSHVKDDDSKESASPPPKRKRAEDVSVQKRSRRSSSPYEMPRKASLSSPSGLSQEKAKPRKASTSGAAPPFTSSNSNTSSSSMTVLRARSEALRKHAREQFVTIFNEMLSEAKAEQADQRAEEYTNEFESALFEGTSEPAPRASFRVAGKAYRDKLRSFLFNLKDKSNSALRSRIADGTLAAHELSTLTSEQLANDSLREEVERRRKENLEQSILKKEAAPLRKLTHKGEIDIEYENAQQRAVTETHDQVLPSHSLKSSGESTNTDGQGSPGNVKSAVTVSAQESSPKPRTVSQSVQSPTLPFDFSNVWQGEAGKDGSERGDEEEASEAEVGATNEQDTRDNEDAGDPDDFIDNFLGMPEGEDGASTTADAGKVAVVEPIRTYKWQGSINMPDEGVFSCRVRQVAGRTLLDEEWGNLLPTQHSLIEGRLPSGSAMPYLLQSRLAMRTELVAFAAESTWLPEVMQSTFKVDHEATNAQTFVRMVDYFEKKDRYGVLQPKKTARGKFVKDFYIVALPKHHTLPEWLTLLGDVDVTEDDRQHDIFLLVAVLFKSQTSPPTSGPTGSADASMSPRDPSSTPSGNIANLLGPGSTTLQDLLRAVGGSRNPPGASPVPPTYSGVGMLSPAYDGGRQSLHAPTAYSAGQTMTPSSVQALSELPKTQLEDVLTRNPTLVDDLLKTLNKSSVPSSSSSPLPPPGPPPMRPPGIAPSTSQAQPHPYASGYPPSTYSAQQGYGAQQRPLHPDQQHLGARHANEYNHNRGGRGRW